MVRRFAPIDEGKKQNIACRLMNGSWPHMAQLEANGELHLTKPFKIKHVPPKFCSASGLGAVIAEMKRTRAVLAAQGRPANSAICLEIHVNNTWFVPPIVIPIGLALAFLCYISALYVF